MKARPQWWSEALARAAYGLVAVVLLGPAVVSIVRVIIGHCDHVPSMDGGPGSIDFINCARVDGMTAGAVVAGSFAAAAALWIRSHSAGPAVLASLGIVIGALPFFYPMYGVVLWSGLAGSIPPLKVAGATALAGFGFASGAILRWTRLRVSADQAGAP